MSLLTHPHVQQHFIGLLRSHFIQSFLSLQGITVLLAAHFFLHLLSLNFIYILSLACLHAGAALNRGQERVCEYVPAKNQTSQMRRAQPSSLWCVCVYVCRSVDVLPFRVGWEGLWAKPSSRASPAWERVCLLLLDLIRNRDHSCAFHGWHRTQDEHRNDAMVQLRVHQGVLMQKVVCAFEAN